METGSVEYVILGIGMNIYVPEEGFPEEIRESAGAIFDKKQNDGKNHLAAEFLNRFLSIYQGIKPVSYTHLDVYKRQPKDVLWNIFSSPEVGADDSWRNC